MLHFGAILLLCLASTTAEGQSYHEGLYDDDFSLRGQCEPITTPLCNGMKYNMTVYPNILGHTSQDKAALEVHQFYPLVHLKCAKELLLYLCSVYVPVCTDLKEAIPPCKHLCIHARNGCEKLMNKFKFNWPSGLNCDDLPEKEKEELCFSSDDVPTTSQDRPGVDGQPGPGCSHTAEFECPDGMRVPDLPQQDGYSFMGAQYCAAPCDEDNIMFWEGYQQEFAHWWIGIWSILCGISTLFTVFTYLIDMSRFRYPERPIVFLSGCYLMVSIVYITGFFSGDTIPCRQIVTEPCQSYGSCHKVVVQGTKEAGCTILFMLLYFFNMASSIWWVILTVTWFLAAGLKWGNEAIEAISHYFHLVAWAIPAKMTIIILAMARVEGDVLSGVCFVGVYDTNALLWFVLIPLVTFLCVGTAFLIAGFIALFHIRTVVKNEGGAKVEKLERLMVRIGVFSVLYTVPATVTIACYFYEHTHRDAWQKGWLAENCGELGIHCPCSYQEYKDVKPDFTVFIIKYFMMLIVGITSGFWIWSGKTFESWGNFRRRICCCIKPRNRRADRNGVTVHMLPQTNTNSGRHMYMRGHTAM